MHYQHGGDIYSYTERFGHSPIDFSANINPRGIPEPVRMAVKTLHRKNYSSSLPEPH